jgi:flagellar biosynthesis/type III secretory pathway protein FliH
MERTTAKKKRVLSSRHTVYLEGRKEGIEEGIEEGIKERIKEGTKEGIKAGRKDAGTK